MGAEASPTRPERKHELVRRVRSHAELLPAIKAGAQAAVFEGPAVDIKFNRDEIEFNGRYMMEAILQAQREPSKTAKIRNDLQKKLDVYKYGHEALNTAMLQMYDAIVGDMHKLAKAMPQYVLEKFQLGLYPNKYITPWHIDDPKDEAPPGTLRYTGCLNGASMEFAKDYSGRGRTVVGRNARTLFTIGTKNACIHRSPADWQPNRLIYILWLVPRAS